MPAELLLGLLLLLLRGTAAAATGIALRASLVC
jgi:hypothetical protein